MTAPTCVTCPWFDPKPEVLRDKPNAGFCRINPPVIPNDVDLAHDYASWPLVTWGDEEWCGRHPGRKPQVKS